MKTNSNFPSSKLNAHTGHLWGTVLTSLSLHNSLPVFTTRPYVQLKVTQSQSTSIAKGHPANMIILSSFLRIHIRTEKSVLFAIIV